LLSLAVGTLFQVIVFMIIPFLWWLVTSGSTIAEAEFHSDSGMPHDLSASGQVANPSGGDSSS